MYMNAHCWIHQKYLTQLIAKFRATKHSRSKGHMMELPKAYRPQILKEDIQFCGLEGFKLSRMSLIFTDPGWLATLAWSKSLWNALVTFSGNTTAWNTSKPPYIGAFGSLQRKRLNACCTTCQLPSAPHVIFIAKQGKHGKLRIHCKDSIVMVWNCWLLPNHLDPQCLCHACDCGSKRLL